MHPGVQGEESVMRNKARRCPVLVEFGGQVMKADTFASDSEEPAQISMRLRDLGWSPYRVRFDTHQAAWIVSSFERLRRH